MGRVSGFAIHGGRRRENELPDPGSADGVEQVDPTHDIGPVVLGWLIDALRHQVQGSEMEYGFDTGS